MNRNADGALKLCYLVERLGPYHIARLNEAAKRDSIVAVELCPDSTTYAWTRPEQSRRFVVRSLERGEQRLSQMRELLGILEAEDFDAVFVNGWSDRAALVALRWCLQNGVASVLMSDSQEHDKPRRFWQESFKRLIVGCCGAAFVAGQRHADYLRVLGMPAERITMGYDVVDNEYFRIEAESARSDASRWYSQLGLPSGNFFLCVARFLEKKNLPALLRAFAFYRRHISGSGSVEPAWSLAVVGEGPLRNALELQIRERGLMDSARLIGFRQYDELPACYGLAGAFVLASTTEQWGLAVNEAMACGLPVILSNRCGCMPDLVEEGINGFTFDPADENQLAELMIRVASANPELRSAWGEASRRIIANWSLERFANGMNRSAKIAIAKPPRSFNSVVTRTIIGALSRVV